jgi:hypothetical protein
MAIAHRRNVICDGDGGLGFQIRELKFRYVGSEPQVVDLKHKAAGQDQLL